MTQLSGLETENAVGLRAKTYALLKQSTHRSVLGRWVDWLLMILISVNVLAVILSTVDAYYQAYEAWFVGFEIFSVAIFSVEYLLRLWSCVEAADKPPAMSNSRYRLRYVFTPMALIDLIAILPFYLEVFFTLDLRFIRVLRLLRIFKLTRYSAAMTMLMDVFREEASAFFAGIFIMVVLLVLAASGAYVVEQDAQPEAFGSIPSAMWWAVATLTTVGYGDVTPVTPMGKIFGACVTIIGIGMAALPAGILANGLADQLRRKRAMLAEQYRAALYDGSIDAHEEKALEGLRRELGLSRVLAEEVRKSFEEDEKHAHAKQCPQCGHEFHSLPTSDK